MLKNLMRGIKVLCLIGLLIFGWSHYDTLAPRAIALYQTSRQNLAAALSGDLSSHLLDADEASQSSTSSGASATKQSHSSSTTANTDASSQVTSSTTSTTRAMTPIESIVQEATLKKTYYYSFASDLPKAGRQVFQAAITAYNQTGLVHLVAGKASGSQNSITFSLYHKKMVAGSTSVELGHGGPDITKQVSWRGTQYWNNATASLNGSYTAAYSKAVAVHELGHALGLDHSSSTESVMYPVSQGKWTLSSADVAALRAIYAKDA
ncbi:matrixin family metalloprotease [Lactiplantibacillus paraplantarum]|uniref:Peptidase M10 n=1 Tax=Lactiplantibacillus paraplantarum TaxID=60520 RepID=A0AAD0TQJ9_9LACO|nr:matrixin family metalloprotease [Lactiplantibacillus paraplantarum]AVW11221.1 peptidase M10 [Lactiplantibacillus paraplantarum]AYJ39634.1 peptidase M10 [Lactiplantibacillus paraplantarum]ERL45728.1 putative extracellular zinc metalloproteinase [Lactiplantibacillus paraplantarum]KRL47691.1 extracellular zinc metalloproteinase [Lactiplantibacillus paraplantarum DSM 10667]MCU4684702.1 matrixin family metalloprotease [Lactiplantibacillus paraplantarum]